MDRSRELDEAVENLAARMKDIFIDGRSLGHAGASARIRGWLSNFDELLGPDSLRSYIEVLRGVTILYDRQILEDCLRFLEKHYDLESRSPRFTCFGSAYESSARIIRLLNHDERYAPDLEDLLVSDVARDEADRPLIIFVDDFLNSGGQFAAILDTWSRASLADRGARVRSTLSAAAFEQLRRAEIVFLFDHGMEEGRLRAEESIKNNRLDATVHCLTTYQDSVGIFGDREDLEAIRAGRPGTVGERSIFRGWRYAELTPFLSVCEQAGTALLQLAKPEWPAPKYADRCLGYGNSAKLYLTEVNVPTCTLTCLWLGGEVEVAGKKVDWKPLVPRHGKKEAGTEHQPVPRRSRPAADGTSRLLDTTLLDFGKTRGSPFEVTLLVPATPSGAPPSTVWKECPPDEVQGRLGFTGLLRPEVKDHLGLLVDSAAPGPRTRVHVLGGRGLSCLNRHLVCECTEDRHPVKVVSAHVTNFADVAAFVAFRLRFTKGPVSLRQAVNLVYWLVFLEEGASRNARIVPQKRLVDAEDRPWTSGQRVLSWLEDATTSDTAGDPFGPATRRYAWERARALVFLRVGGGLFQMEPAVSEELIKVVSSFARPAADGMRRHSDVSHFRLQQDALVGLGPYGAAVLCGDGPGANVTFLSEYFHHHYCFLFELAHHLEAVCTRLRLPCAADDEWRARARAWLGRMRAFPFESACQRPYMNRFLQEMNQRMRLSDLMAETCRLLGVS